LKSVGLMEDGGLSFPQAVQKTEAANSIHQQEKTHEDYCSCRCDYVASRGVRLNACTRGWGWAGAFLLAQSLSGSMKEKPMKTIVRIVLATLLLVACSSAPVLADGGPVPACWPNPCPDQ